MRATERTQVRRKPERARYDEETVNAILDEALICHVGFVDADGRPVVIPTIHARDGDALYLHGSPAARMIRSLATGIDACVTVSIVDGLVLARSAFHHSLNYRSVVVFGRAELVADADEKLAAMRAVVEHVVAGRWSEARMPTPKEIAATTILRLPLDEASAKVRVGPPIDEDDDMDLDVWAGVVPLQLAPHEAQRDPEADPTLPLPESVRALPVAPRYAR